MTSLEAHGTYLEHHGTYLEHIWTHLELQETYLDLGIYLEIHETFLEINWTYLELHLTNWRPLTLLNTLYKLITSIFAERLKKNLNKILGSHQKAYIPDIFISEATKNCMIQLNKQLEQNIPA